jgi:hypothetical protein
VKKPTIEQIQECIDERGYLLDAEQFFYHYEAVGWMIGRNKMKDWKCALTTWFIRGGKKKKTQAQDNKNKQYESICGAWLPGKTLLEMQSNDRFMGMLDDLVGFREWAESINELVKEI